MKNKLTAFFRPLTIILSFAILYNGPAQSQVIRSFSQRAAAATPTKLIYNIKGDYTMIGNTNLTLDVYGDNTNNSNNLMHFVDVDGDANTLNSSSATLTFSTENGANPACSRILFAGLYWTGRASNGLSSPDSFSVTKGALTKTLHKRKVSIKGPGQSSYSTLVANPGNIYYPQTSEGFMYSAFIEVTDYVKNCGLGSYTVADIALIEGNGGSTGYYGGWGMLVVYENSKMNWRDVTIFDGHAYVTGNATLSYDLPVSGFHTAQSGPINLKLGLMAGEGDVGISGDYFKIRNYQDNAWITLSHSGNTTTNFFNGSVNTGGNVRNPNLQNNTGLDMAMFNIPNAANSVVTNNQTSTKFQYGSTQDTYIIFCIAMSVDAYVPDVEALVATETINGVPVGSGPLTVQPGQDIEYKVQIKNQGTEAVDNTIFTIPIPYTTTYVANSASVTINFNPPPTPNSITFNPNIGLTGAIVWNFGTLPLPPPSNPDSVLAELVFHFTVTSDCNILKNPDCPPKVTLSGSTISGTGAISGANFSNMPFIQGYQTSGGCAGEPITDPLEIAIDAAAYNAANCQNVPAYHAFVFCNYTAPTIPVDSISQAFPPGLQFYNTNNVTPTSILYDQNNPFPATVGTYTYFAIPVGIPLCYYTFSIHVSNITSVPTTQDVTYCLNNVAVPLTATPSNPAYSIAYYTSLNSASPSYTVIPSTSAPGITTYYVGEGFLSTCISSQRDSIKVTVYDLLQPVIDPLSIQSVLCKGDATGAALVNASGGNQNYSYSWSTNPIQTSASATGLAAGQYTVTLNDNSGCAIPATATVSISEPAVSLAVQISSQQNINCQGDLSGSATATGSGGSNSYIYSWSTNPVQTTAMATGLAAGNYTVTLWDLNGCAIPATASASLSQPVSALSNSVTSTQYNGYNISCFGLSNGNIDLTVTGGTTSYTYAWSNGATTQDLSGLMAGSYSVAIVDAAGCTSAANYTLTQPAALTSSISITSNFNGQPIRCNGLADGTLDLSINGGVPSWSYQWSHGSTIEDPSGLTAGTYTVLVTDANSCTATASVTLTEPAALTTSLSATTSYNGFEISCSGALDGGLQVVIGGGTPGYDFTWNNGSTTQNITGVGAGSYVVLVTDTNGCITANSFTLTEPGAILAQASVMDVPCFGQNSGSIDLSVTGGVPGYNYLWSNGSTAQDISGLSAGNYSVQVTDLNGCTHIYSDLVAQAAALDLSASYEDLKCYNISNGAIGLQVSGGTAPYQFQWNTGDTTSSLSGLQAGSYIVSISDDNNCQLQDTIVLNQPDSLGSSIQAFEYANGHHVSLNNAQDGSIDLTVNGGTAPYSYFWNNGSLMEDQFNVPAGQYTVMITDANDCILYASITLTEPFELEMPTGYSPNSDGFNDYFVVHGLESYPDNDLQVFNRWGNIVYSSLDYHNQWKGESNTGAPLPDATYFVVLRIFGNEEITLTGFVDLRR